MSATKPISIRQCFADVPDPRREHMRLHNLWDIIAITILAVVAGADSWVEVAKCLSDKCLQAALRYRNSCWSSFANNRLSIR
jgi:hypothetical protein